MKCQIVTLYNTYLVNIDRTDKQQESCAVAGKPHDMPL